MQGGALANRTPYFQEFHTVLRENALGLLMRPLNDHAIVFGLRRPDKALHKKDDEDEDMMAAEKAGVRVGSILVAVNGSRLAAGFDEAIAKVKSAGRPVTLGFRLLHPVSDPGLKARRLWQGYLFFRFSMERVWTGRFYVLRDDGQLRAYAGKDLSKFVDELKVLVTSSTRCREKEVQEAARAMGDLGDDDKGTLGPRVLAVPVQTDDYLGQRTKWAFFKADTDDAKDDWYMALTTLCVVHEQQRAEAKRRRRQRHNESPSSSPVSSSPLLLRKKKDLFPLAALPMTRSGSAASVESLSSEADIPLSDETPVLRQGYLKMKVSQKSHHKDNVAAQAALDFATRLEPWRRRWFVVRGKLLKWYVNPPADASEVPSGVLKLARAIVAVSDVEHEKSVYSSVDETKNSSVFEFSVIQMGKDRMALKLRCEAHDDGKEWVKMLRSQATDDMNSYDKEKKVPEPLDTRLTRAARLEACRRDPSLVLLAPDVAYALLVPVDRSDGVDRDAFCDVAGQFLGPLCDDYVADVVYEALVGRSENICDDEAPLPEQQTSFFPPEKDNALHVASENIMSPENHHHKSALKHSKFKAQLSKTYTAAKRFGVDASLRVSELLADNKDAIIARQIADVKTSRREAEALTPRDLRLSDEVFRKYCESFKAVTQQQAQEWDDLRCRLGNNIYDLETLVLREDHVVDQFSEEGLLFLTDRRLYLRMKASSKVLIVDLSNLLAIEGLRGRRSPGGEKHHIVEGHVLRLKFKPNLKRHVFLLSLQRPPSNSTFLGEYPGGGKIFGNSVLRPRVHYDDDVLYVVHGGDPDLSDADDDLNDDDTVKKINSSEHHLDQQDDHVQQRETPSSGFTTTTTTSYFEARSFDDDTYALRLPRPTRSPSAKTGDERARRWIEAIRELVAANAISKSFERNANSFEGVEATFQYYWNDLRKDARRFPSQREFFAADRRKLPLWAALNLIRREAIYACCGRAPKRLLVCTYDRSAGVLKRFLDAETNWARFPKKKTLLGPHLERDSSWFRAAVSYASRLEDLKRRRRSDIETFSPMRFRDEWTTFWVHVDPMWDCFFDTIKGLRRWDDPFFSGLVFSSLMVLAITDKLAYLPSVIFLTYALAVVVNGNRVRDRRSKRRSLRSRFRKNNKAFSADKTMAAKASRTLKGLFSTRRSVDTLDDTEIVRPDDVATIDSDDLDDAELVLPSTNSPGSTNSPVVLQVVEKKPSPNFQPQSFRSDPLEQFFGVFGQLRDLRAGLGKAQAAFHYYNTLLLRCRSLHRWTDPARTASFVAFLVFSAILCALVPLHILFATVVAYLFSDPLFKTRGLSRALADEYFGGLPTPSRTHGNVHFAAMKRHKAEDGFFPPLPPFLHFGRTAGDDYAARRTTTTKKPMKADIGRRLLEVGRRQTP